MPHLCPSFSLVNKMLWLHRIDLFQNQRQNHIGLSLSLNTYLFPTCVSDIAFFCLFKKTLQCILFRHRFHQRPPPKKNYGIHHLASETYIINVPTLLKETQPDVSSNVFRIFLDSSFPFVLWL